MIRKHILWAILLCLLVGGLIWGFRKSQTVDNGVDNKQAVSVKTESSDPLSDYSTTTLKISGKVLTVAVADSETKLMNGLGGVNSMPEDFGMIFLFSSSDYRDFWMKDMKFPLDIIWVDENDVVVHIEKNLTPETFPKIYSSPKPCFYVLEFNAGFSNENGLKIGDHITFGSGE